MTIQTIDTMASLNHTN